MASRIKCVVSVCTIKDIATWKYTAQGLVQFVDAESYYLIVPERYLKFFQAVTDPRITIVSENHFTQVSLDAIKSQMPPENAWRAGWYYQQLLKILAVLEFSENEEDLVVIWDADTIPIRDIHFIRDGRVVYFHGIGQHEPYFDQVRNMLGLERGFDFSFIAQCFPSLRKWIVEFCQTVEARHAMPWYDSIIATTDLTQLSGFSEYESLGSFIFATHFGEIGLHSGKWYRGGWQRAPRHLAVEFGKTEENCYFMAYEDISEVIVPVSYYEGQQKPQTLGALGALCQNLADRTQFTAIVIAPAHKDAISENLNLTRTAGFPRTILMTGDPTAETMASVLEGLDTDDSLLIVDRRISLAQALTKLDFSCLPDWICIPSTDPDVLLFHDFLGALKYVLVGNDGALIYVKKEISVQLID